MTNAEEKDAIIQAFKHLNYHTSIKDRNWTQCSMFI